MSDCESTSSSADYFTAEEDVVAKDTASNLKDLEISLEPEFLLWLSSNGTKWYLPKYYRPELDLNICVSKFEKIIDEFT